jgi:phosphopantetheinyl transferase
MRAPTKATHVWVRSADQPVGRLTSAERAELSTIAHAGRAAEFRRARPWSRAVLADYLQIDPLAVRFWRGRWGKPHLVGHDLQFNLSHSGNVVVLAVSDRPVGIDIEQTSRDLRTAVFRCSSKPERRRLPGRTGAEVVAVWTVKEAYAKAKGLGHRLTFATLETDQDPVTGSWSVRGDRQLPVEVRSDVPGHVLAVARSSGSPVTLVMSDCAQMSQHSRF